MWSLLVFQVELHSSLSRIRTMAPKPRLAGNSFSRQVHWEEVAHALSPALGRRSLEFEASLFYTESSWIAREQRNPVLKTKTEKRKQV